MHVLFIHQGFPAQFGRLALELQRRYGWKCTFLIERASTCPTPSPDMLRELEIFQLPLSAEFRSHGRLPWVQVYGRALELSQAVYDALESRPGLRPDLVVAHGPDGCPTLFLSELLDCPIVTYCEYYFAPTGRDPSYRLDLLPAEPAPFFPRNFNAVALVTLEACDSAYSPTHWQRNTYPRRFHHKIEVHFDGIDAELFRPRSVPRVIAGRTIPEGTRIVTYAARGLESIRGFDLFLRVAHRIARERPDVVFAVAGAEKTFYGWDELATGNQSFARWAMSQEDYDLSRFIFLGQIPLEQLAHVLCLSDLHIYLTVPFVLSWSMIDALACGCVVLGSDVPPVREVIEPGATGLVEPLFDTDRMVETALRVLDNPADYRPVRRAARVLVEERYSLEVAIPRLKDYFERVAGRRASSTA